MIVSPRAGSGGGLGNDTSQEPRVGAVALLVLDRQNIGRRQLRKLNMGVSRDELADLKIQAPQAAYPYERGEVPDIMPGVQTLIVEPVEQLRHGEVVAKSS